MAQIADQLTSDMNDARRARDSTRVSALSYLLSTMKNARIEAMHPLSEGEETDVLRKQAKMRRDSIDQYRKAGREDLATKEEAELTIIEQYLPAAPSAEQIRAAVRAAIAESGASGPKDMGPVMRATLSRLGGQADGRAIQGIVREELAAMGG